MKKRTLALVLSTMLAAGLVLTGCDENGLPTEEEITEITKGLEEFSATMETVTDNVSEFTEGMDEYMDAAEDIEEEVLEVLDEDVIGSIVSVDDVADAAGVVVEEFGSVADAVDASAPELEKLGEDLITSYDDVNLIAQDIVDIYSKEEVQALIDELETMIK